MWDRAGGRAFGYPWATPELLTRTWFPILTASRLPDRAIIAYQERTYTAKLGAIDVRESTFFHSTKFRLDRLI